jgi:hypothetical protein
VDRQRELKAGRVGKAYRILRDDVYAMLEAAAEPKLARLVLLLDRALDSTCNELWAREDVGQDRDGGRHHEGAADPHARRAPSALQVDVRERDGASEAGCEDDHPKWNPGADSSRSASFHNILWRVCVAFHLRHHDQYTVTGVPIVANA